MDYEIMKNIVNYKLENFITQYKNVSKLFENVDVKNKLLHPGEYGVYKENLIKELLRFVLPQKYEIGTGFVFNSQKEITGQCDIVIFDYLNAPLMEIEEKTRFFQQEIVFSIGEIKSTLTKNEFKDALVKLSEKKKIRQNFTGLNDKGEVCDVNVENMYAGIFSFLICDGITGIKKGERDKINKLINEAYEEKHIEAQYRHNIIIDLEEALIAYRSNEIVNELLKTDYDTIIPLAKVGGINLDIAFVGEDEKEILSQFLIHINNTLKNMYSYYPEPGHYF